MKWLMCILSLWMVFLLCIPCEDDLGEDFLHLATEMQTDHQDSTDHFDFCSPFCACACCATRGFPQLTPHSPNDQRMIFTASWPEYPAGLFDNFLYDIWRPPIAA